MRINARRLGLAAAESAAVSYVICALAVALVPGGTNAVFSYVMHADLSGLARTVTWDSFVVGLLLFSAGVGLLVWLAARFYNALGGSEQAAGARAAQRAA